MKATIDKKINVDFRKKSQKQPRITPPVPLEIQLQQARVLIASMYIQKDGWSERVKEEVKKFML